MIKEYNLECFFLKNIFINIISNKAGFIIFILEFDIINIKSFK